MTLPQGSVSIVEFTNGTSYINYTLAGYDNDPYLEALPDFAYAMPVQVVVMGMNITLLGVLLIHLLFTVRYHWPLSKKNYTVQVAACALSVLRKAFEMWMLMSTLKARPKVWPYMFDYIEIELPPESWGVGQNVAWTLFSSIQALSIHVVHIQFLTMLFPSRLEWRLIMTLLGPLSLLASFLHFTELSPYAAVQDLGDAIRHTANSTLTLLYTLAIFLWAFALNRRRVWRTEGGTAAFGVVACLMGVCGTAMNFVEVYEQRMRWLPGVVNCILLWQSWTSFWVWVGSGMWDAEAEEVRKKEKRQQEKRERKERKAAMLKAGLAASDGGDASSGNGPGARIRRRLQALDGSTSSRPGSRSGVEAIELVAVGTSSPRVGATGTGTTNSAPGSRPGLAASITSGSTQPPTGILGPVYEFFKPVLLHLRGIHDAAAVQKAAEPKPAVDEGWGLGAMGTRGRRERGERLRRLSAEREGRREEEEEEEEEDEEAAVSGAEAWVDDAAQAGAEGDAQRKPKKEAKDRWTSRGWVKRWRVKEVTKYD